MGMKEEADWDFMEGTANYTYEHGCHYGDPCFTNGPQDDSPVLVSPDVEKMAVGVPLKGWYRSIPQDISERHWMTKIYDPDMKYKYEHVADATAAFLDHVENRLEHVRDRQGMYPYDAVVTFNNASNVVNLATAELRMRGKEIPWRVSVQLCPYPFRDPRYESYFESQLDHPVVLVFGQLDWAYGCTRE